MQPLVSICSLTYNHAPYIRQCLDGFLMQKTNFAFEVLINDDCSTDGTTEILKEYAERYPDIVIPVYHEENLYSKGMRGFYERFLYPRARGKYIALCEGDDYWTDPLKLQKQVDFLEANPEYSMCFHSANVFCQSSGQYNDLFAYVQDREYEGVEFIKKWTVPTASVCFRRNVIDSELYQTVRKNPYFVYGDLILFLSCASLGRIRGLSSMMSVYRRLDNGAVLSAKSPEMEVRLCRQVLAYAECFGEKYTKVCRDIFFERSSMFYLASLFKRHSKANKRLLKQALDVSFHRTIVSLFKAFYVHLKLQVGKAISR